MYRRFGVWAFEKGHQLCRNLLVITAMSTDNPTSNTPKRRYAETPIRFCRRRRLLVLYAVGATLLLASCAANQPAPKPETHKMVGTNSPGY
jgi:hypothetical protein